MIRGIGARAYTITYAGLALAVLLLRLSSEDLGAGVFIALMEGCAILWVLVPQDTRSLERSLLLGVLAGSLLGDMILNWTPWRALCVFPFTAVHLCLFALSQRLRPVHPFPVVLALALLAAGVCFYLWLLPSMPGPAEAVVAAAYQLLLAAMLWRALALLAPPRHASTPWLLPGAFLYYATDHVVIYHQIHPSAYTLFLIWICYPAALYLLSRANRHL